MVGSFNSLWQSSTSAWRYTTRVGYATGCSCKTVRYTPARADRIAYTATCAKSIGPYLCLVCCQPNVVRPHYSPQRFCSRAATCRALTLLEHVQQSNQRTQCHT